MINVEYEEYVFLAETIGDKLFLSMTNLYFFNHSIRMHVGFSESFSNGQVPDFRNIFPVRDVMA